MGEGEQVRDKVGDGREERGDGCVCERESRECEERERER